MAGQDLNLQNRVHMREATAFPTGRIGISSREPVPDNLVNHSPGQNKREMNKNVRTGAAGALAGMPGNKPVSPLSV